MAPRACQLFVRPRGASRSFTAKVQYMAGQYASRPVKVDSSEINYCLLRHFILCDANSFAAKRHTHAIWCPNYHCRQGDHSTLMNLCTLPISGKTFGPLKRSISSQRRS